MKNKLKRNIVWILIVFIILIYFNTGIIGLVSGGFGTEAVSLGTGNAAIYPMNMSGTPNITNVWQNINRQVNFTYNVSAANNDNITNCTLWMDIDNAGYEANETLNRSGITPVINQTFNETFQSGIHDIIWKIGCYDNASDQTNTSARNLYINYLVTQSAPNIGAHAYVDENYVVGQWRFEQANRTWTYDETGLNNGTLSGGVKWCPDDGDSQEWNCSGRIGKGVMFDGVDDSIYKSVANFRSNDEQGTISAWIKMNELTTDQCIFGSSDEATNNYYLTFQIPSTGHLLVSQRNNDLPDVIETNNIVLAQNKWYHVALVSDGSQYLLYINGQSETFDISIGLNSGDWFADTDNRDNFAFGTLKVSTALNKFNGTIDEVTIWNRSLSAEEIMQLYNSSAGTYDKAFTIQDISASNNNTGDEDNDTIKFIYNWYYNDSLTERFTPIAVLNMPFEAVNNGSEMNFTKDYSGYENHGSTNFNSNVFECKGTGSTRSCSGWNRTGGYDGFGAYEFDGLGDYINLSNSSSLDSKGDSFAVAVWIKTNSSINNNYVLGKWGATVSGGFYMQIRNTILRLFVQDDGFDALIESSTIVNDNVWHHLVGTSDGSNISIYVDGAFENTKAVTNVDLSAVEEFYIGRIANSNFNGTIDEVMIFNRSLSAEQVKALYYNQTQTIKSQETNPEEMWKAQVVANDGYGDSIAYNTSALTIDNVTLKVGLQAPVNYYNTSSKSIDFTYNVTDLDSIAGVINCSLWLYNTTNDWSLNSTEDYPEVNINQTFNLTFDIVSGSINWTVACYDKEHEQTNSSSYKLNFISEGVGGGFGQNLRNVKNVIVQAGVPKVIEFYNPNIPVISVIVTLNRGAELSLAVEKIFESIIEDKLDNVYSYFVLSSNLENDYFENVAVNFKIKKDYENIKLYQFGDGWNEKQITQFYEDSKYNYYQVLVNGLGYFAISGIQIEEEKEEVIVESVESVESSEPKSEIVKSKINWNSFLGAFLLLNLILMVTLFYRDRIFTRRVKIFGGLSLSILIFLSLSYSNVNVTGFGVYTTGVGSIVGVIFLVMLVIVVLIGLIYLIMRLRGREEIPVDEKVQFKLLAREIRNKLENDRVIVVGDYEKLIALYKKLIEEVEEDEGRELYNIIEDVYEKYYSEIIKSR